jgi:hypothetical protein
VWNESEHSLPVQLHKGCGANLIPSRGQTVGIASACAAIEVDSNDSIERTTRLRLFLAFIDFD